MFSRYPLLSIAKRKGRCLQDDQAESFFMNELGKIILTFSLVAFPTSCNTPQTKEQHTRDSTLNIQTVGITIPEPATVDDGRYLSKYSKEHVLNRLDYTSDSIIKRTNSDIQEWKFIDGSIIVLNKLELARGDNRQSLEICLLKEIAGNLQLIARGTSENNSDDEDSYYLMNTRFDASTYRINEQEYAVGVTGTPTWAHNGSSYYNLGTNLLLFRVTEKIVSPIALLPLEYTHGDRHQENDSIIFIDNEDSSSSEIILLDSKTNNYFDILLKTKTINISDKKATPTITLRNTIYQWNDGKYVKTQVN